MEGRSKTEDWKQSQPGDRRTVLSRKSPKEHLTPPQAPYLYVICLFGFAGVCPVSELALKYLLTQKGSGNAVVIMVGGGAEALLCHPGATTVLLKQRNGFVKVALETGWVPRF